MIAQSFLTLRELVEARHRTVDISVMELTSVRAAASSALAAGDAQARIALATLKQGQDASRLEAEALIRMGLESSAIGPQIDLTA